MSVGKTADGKVAVYASDGIVLATKDAGHINISVVVDFDKDEIRYYIDEEKVYTAAWLCAYRSHIYKNRISKIQQKRSTDRNKSAREQKWKAAPVFCALNVSEESRTQNLRRKNSRSDYSLGIAVL